VIQEAVQEAMSFLDSIDEIPVAIELIKILRGITEGKIFVELELAELTKKLAEIYEKTEKIKEK
jgi:26S proteasome regulatory subunit N5